MQGIDVGSFATSAFGAQLEKAKGKQAVKGMKALGITKTAKERKAKSQAKVHKIMNPMVIKQRKVVTKLRQELEAANAADKSALWLKKQLDDERAYLKKLMS